MRGEVFTRNPVTYSPLADETFEDPHNISTKLHHRVGGFVNIHLRFSSNWILISNVDLISALFSCLDDGLITQRNENYKTSTSTSNLIYMHLCEYKRFTFEHSCCPDHERKMFLFHYVLLRTMDLGKS